jgi:tetratricopeptide (TPR) repeat protein
MKWRVFLTIAAAFGVVVGLSIGFWPSAKMPEPPELNLEGTDPGFRAALEKARDAIHASPKSASAWAEYGKVLRAGVYREQAAECFAVATQLDPKDPRWPHLSGEALMSRDPALAAARLRLAVSRCERAHVESLPTRVRLANALIASGQIDEADDCLQRILETDPEQPLAHLLLGQVADYRNQAELSREHCKRCLESPFTRKQAYTHLAELSRRLGDIADAEKLEIQANSLPADFKLFDPWLDECMRTPIGASAALRRATQLEIQGRFGEAVAILREIVAQEPNYKAYVGLGKFLPSLGDLPGAEQALRQALELDPKGLQAHYYLSRVLWVQAEQKRRAGADKEANALLEQSIGQARATIELKSDYGLAYLSMGIALKQLHRDGEAVDALRQAIHITPDLPDSYLHLAELLAAEGKTEEARRILQQGLPLAKPEDTRVKDALAKLEHGDK